MARSLRKQPPGRRPTATRFIARLIAYGVDPLCDRPEQFMATIAADIPFWADVVKISGAASQ